MTMEGFKDGNNFSAERGDVVECSSLDEGVIAIRRAMEQWEEEHPNVRSLLLVAGPSASGKDTLIDRLGFSPENTLHLSLDRYYRDGDPSRPSNFSVPDALDGQRIKSDIQAILSANEGGVVKVPVYSMRDSRRIGEEEVRVKRRLVVEGVYALIQVLAPASARVYIETEKDVRLSRKIGRDLRERGIPEEVVRERFERTGQPATEKYVMPQRAHATIIVHNNER